MINIVTSKYAIAAVLSLLISLALGPIAIPALRRLKFGQNIRKEGPQSHLKKAGTPTIGGLIFIGSTLITMLALRLKWNDEAMIVLYSLIAFGFIGFLDDLLKIIKKDNEGLKAWQKMVLLLVFSGAIAYYGYLNLSTSMIIPFLGKKVALGMFYIPFVIFIYAATTNAVNLTDGLDGLASTVSVLVLTFFAVSSFILGHDSVGLFCIALIGGLIGFLKYNAYPARIFMGDTGSLAIGGAIATIAIILEIPLLIPVVGGIYVLETLSVIIQVTSFKLTGKRIFKMAPIHHHFEQCGWSEVKIVTVFSVVTVILCMIGFWAL
ncbi:Phospho-N-acetylmuramoyl-pentapeptide-transferase [uncultured Clostridium sp.]|uniref:phospho-N-acetylmuramoyl-pentapeptide- transferase n=1 Tax=uncultured Clostridium sp. TaxID=59620 RepID=UPI00082187B0|nr:phospho-N-acetylmuramoyl-pentapeptide-transferase [uncultured Clostridium sp.]SCJ55145.1 Phospho-N-acetylmuramoyl-pentapeptide-transferase [uncultured Clostridium sp.]